MITIYGIRIDLGYFLLFCLVLWTALSTSFAVWLSRRLWPRDEVKLEPEHALYPLGGLPEMSDEMKAELRQSLAELVAKSDRDAIAGDWQAVGDDLRVAMGKAKKEVDRGV